MTSGFIAMHVVVPSCGYWVSRPAILAVAKCLLSAYNYCMQCYFIDGGDVCIGLSYHTSGIGAKADGEELHGM